MTRGRSYRVVVGLADQMVYSLTNFIATLTVAHYATAEQFGAFSLMMATQLILTAVSRGLCAEPVVVRTSAARADVWWAAVQAKLGVATGFGAVAGVSLFLLCAVVLPHQFEPFALVYAFAPIVVVVQDFLRYAALAAARPLTALGNDLTVLVVQVALVAGVTVTMHRAPSTYVAIWVIASACGLIVGLIALRLPLCLPTRARIGQDSDLAGRFAFDNLITQVSLQGVAYIVVAVGGLAAAGGFRAAQTVYMPLAVLVLGIQTAVLPELVRVRAVSVRAMQRTLTKIAAGVATLSVVYLALVAICPQSLGPSVFGASWSQAQPLLVLIGLGTLAGGPVYIAVAGLRALGAASATLRVRWVTVSITVACVTVGAIAGDPRGAAAGLAASTVIQAVLWWLQLNASCRHADEGVAALRPSRLLRTGGRPSPRVGD